MSDEKIVPIDKHESFKGVYERLLESVNKGLDWGQVTGEDELGAGLWDTEIKAFMEASTLKGLFFHEDWVFILVDLVADTVSMSPLRVMRSEMKGSNEVVTPEDDHIVNSIIDMPNEWQDYHSWMYNYIVEYVLMGNAIQWRARASNQLIILPADIVNLDFDNKGKLNRYIVTSGGQGQAGGPLLEGMAFSLNEVWHQRRPNPASMLWGLSPFVPNRKSLLFNRYSMDYLNSFYLKGATPGMAIKMSQNVNEENAKRFLRSFEMAHTGRKNQRRTLMLPKGADIEVITPSLGDQQLVELINNNREKIINILRVPKHALSLAESGSLGSEEHKQALKFFYTNAIIPLQQKVAGYLTRMFQRDGTLEVDRYLEFDNGNVEVLKDDMIKKAELGAMLISSKQWTPNEVRDKLWEMEPTDGGDALGGPQPAAPSLFGMGDLPPEEEPEEEMQEENLALEEWIDPEQKMLSENKLLAIKEKYGQWLEVSQKQMDAEVESKEEAFIKAWLKIFEEQAKAAVKIVKDELEKVPKKDWHVFLSTKADDDIPDKLPKKRKMRARLIKEFNKKKNDTLDATFDKLMNTIERGYELQLDLVFNEAARDEIEALRSRDENKRRQILRARGLETFAAVNETTTDKIMNQIETGVRKKETIQDIAKRISDKFTEVSPGRAMTIARTEVLTAVSIGKEAAMRNAAEVIPNIKKIWINLGDDRVRDSHLDEADGGVSGEIVDHDEPFSNGLMYPRDVRSKDPAEVINCRCDFLMVPEEDLGDINF